MTNTSPMLDVNRISRIQSALADVSWCMALYPPDQNEDVWANLSSATVHLVKALELAKQEVRDAL